MNILSSTFQELGSQSLHFLHIPKTAGTSLRMWLLDLFQEGDLLPYHFLKEIENFSQEDFKTYRFFSGHFGLKIHNILATPVTSFTWLRQPIEREFSQYFYVKNNEKMLLSLPLNPFSADYIKAVKKLSISELVRSNTYVNYYDNLQVRALARAFPPEDKPHPCDNTMLKIAKDSLLNLSFWGICEWMSPSIDLFNYHFGFPCRSLNLYQNVSPESTQKKLKQFSEEDIKLIREVNHYDEELYRLAQEEFLRRFQQMWQQVQEENNIASSTTDEILKNYENPEYKKAVALFLKNNFQRRQKNILKHEKMNVNFAEAIFLSGWYSRFYWEPLKLWLRWAGPQTSSSIYLPLKAGINYQINFVVRYCMAFDILESLHLQIGETIIPLTRTEIFEAEDSPQFKMTGEINSKLIKPEQSCTEIIFKTNRTVPLEYNSEGSTLVNHVSFATDGLSIVPQL